MAEATTIHLGENSPEHVAFKLMASIANNEGKTLTGANASADRRWILSTYAECLRTVRQAAYDPK